MNFEDKLEEAMMFGTGSYMDLDELRLLYHGRRDIYVSFTDQGDFYFQTQNNEIDRPDSIVCYPVNDVIGRKVSTSEFYANVFRLNKTKGEFISNINHYTNDDLAGDLVLIRQMNISDADTREDIINDIMRDSRIRKPFDKLWNITEFLSKTRSSYGAVWKKMLMDLGYIGFADPSSSGIFTGYRTPAVIYLDYKSRSDLDIIPIQKHRMDPRKRVRDKVERQVRRMGVRRNRIAKRRVDPSTRNQRRRSGSFKDTIAVLRDLL